MAYLYDPTQWVITFIDHTVVGFGAGTKMKAMFNADATTTVIGGDGTPTVVVGTDKSGRIEISLQSGSASDQYFSELHEKLMNGNAKAAIGRFFAKHLGDGSTIEGETASIAKHADGEVSNELVGRTWTFNVGKLSIKSKTGVQL